MQPDIASPSLRQALRQKRRALDPRQQRQHSQAVCRHLLRLPWLLQARHIGLYLGTDGEVDLRPLQQALRHRPQKLYLPVLRPGQTQRLWFAPYRPGDCLRPNRFGIAEPITRYRPPLNLRRLDLVLMPLVGFDDRLHRLGMGGGYYDRSFAFLRRGRWHRPRLLGVAHECQRLTRLQPKPWDLAMDALVTERGLYLPEPKKGPHWAVPGRRVIGARLFT